MSPQRILLHAIILGYLVVTAGAFAFSMTKRTVLPYRVIHWSYGMMAPYQGDTTWNADLRAVAELPDGTRERVDIDQYLPFGFGERNVRKFLRFYAKRGVAGQRAKFTEFAEQLLRRERARGKQYTSLDLTFERWPRSPIGFEALRLPHFLLQNEFVTHVQ